MALFALRWLDLEQPAGGSVYGWLLVAAITVLVGAIAARTVVAIAHGQLLPSPQGAPEVAHSRPLDASGPLRSAA